MTIELTKEEAEMLENYLFKKQINLENSDLTDAKCYRLILSIRKKLSKKQFTNNLFFVIILLESGGNIIWNSQIKK